MRPPLAIGVDLGGSHVSFGLVDPGGTIHDQLLVKIDNLQPPEVTLEILAENIRSLKNKQRNIRCVGIGLPGNHDSKRGICRVSPNFPHWHHVEVTPFLSRSVQMPVYMLNDVRVATLGELHFGAGKGLKNIVMLAIGTGIGGGVVIDGELLVGKNEAAGELGHITIDPDGPRCGCGNRGCMEAFASGPAIAAKGAEAIIRKKITKIRKKIKSLDEINPKLIAEAANEGDEVALEIFEEAGRAVGIGISILAVALNPELFILGGGVSQAGDLLFTPIRKTLQERLRIIPPEIVSIVPAGLGVKAGLVGAAAYAFLRSGISIN